MELIELAAKPRFVINVLLHCFGGNRQNSSSHLHHLRLVLIVQSSIGIIRYVLHIVLGVLFVKINLEGQDDHGDGQADQGGNKDPAQGAQSDAFGVVQGWAKATQG